MLKFLQDLPQFLHPNSLPSGQVINVYDLGWLMFALFMCPRPTQARMMDVCRESATSNANPSVVSSHASHDSLVSLCSRLTLQMICTGVLHAPQHPPWEPFRRHRACGTAWLHHARPERVGCRWATVWSCHRALGVVPEYWSTLERHNLLRAIGAVFSWTIPRGRMMDQWME